MVKAVIKVNKREREALRRLRVENRLLNKLRRILKEEPIAQVIGKLDLGAAARCCRDGTYAILKIDPSAVEKRS